MPVSCQQHIFDHSAESKNGGGGREEGTIDLHR